MERIVYQKTLDVHKSGVQFTLSGFETADNLARRVEISLMASGDAIDFPLEKIMAVMYVNVPGTDGPSVIECEIKNNTVVYDVLPIVTEGITEMQLKLIEIEPEGAKKVLATPKFAIEVSKSNMNEDGAVQTTAFTALEEALARAKAVYDSRFLRMELSSDCMFRAFYADGTVFESDMLRELFHKGESILSQSYARGDTGVRKGESTDNSRHYSKVAKSASIESQEIKKDAQEILDEVRQHGVYTAFKVNFETGEVEYISPRYNFKINTEDGNLEAIGQSIILEDEIGLVVTDWLVKNKVDIKELLDKYRDNSAKITTLETEKADKKDVYTKDEVKKELGDVRDSVSFMSSYLTFVGNVNKDVVDAAFGKNQNDADIVRLGKALAMYAKWLNPDININEKYPNLWQVNNISELHANTLALRELADSRPLLELINNTEYPCGRLSEHLPLCTVCAPGYDDINTRTWCVDEVLYPMKDTVPSEGYTITLKPVPHAGFYSFGMITPIYYDTLSSSDTKPTSVIADVYVNGNCIGSPSLSGGVNLTGDADFDNDGSSEKHYRVWSTAKAVAGPVFITPEDEVAVRVTPVDYKDAALYIETLSNYTGTTCIANSSPEDDTSKVAFGVSLSETEPYYFTGPSGYYRVYIPHWVYGVTYENKTNPLLMEVSLNIGDNAIISIDTISNTSWGFEQGSYDDILYIENGEKIEYSVLINNDSAEKFISSIMFYNATGSYPHLNDAQ